jgi:hypothetical protein
VVNVEVAVKYAITLCDVGRWQEAAPLIDGVLARVPQHVEAKRLRQFIDSQRTSS